MIDPFMDYLNRAKGYLPEMPSSPADALGSYYGGLFTALDLPGKAVRSAISPGQDQAVFNQAFNTGGRIGLTQPGPFAAIPSAAGLAFGADWARHFTGQASPLDTFLQTQAQHAPTGSAGGAVGELLGSVAFDPLTPVGSGATARAPQAIQATERVFQTALNKALLAPALLPKAALDIPIPGFAQTAGKYMQRYGTDAATDAVTKTPARSIGDYLWGGPSRRAQLHLYGQDIQDIAERLMSRGHELELDMADFTNARNGTLVPPYDPQHAPGQLTTIGSDIRSTIQGIAPTHAPQAQALDDAVMEHAREIMGVAAPEEKYRKAFLLADAVSDVAAAIRDGKLTTPDDVFSAFRRRTDALDLLAQGRTGILADLPDNLKTRAEVAFGAMSKHGDQLRQDKDQIEEGVRALWDLENARRGGTLGAYSPIGGVRNGDDAIRELNARLTQMGHAPITPTKDAPYSVQLRDFLAGRIDDVTHNKLSDALKTWGSSGDPLTENSYRLVFDKTIRDRAHQLQLDPDKTGALGWLDNLTTLWKSIQLMSPSYLGTNAISGTASSALMGISPGEIQKNLITNIFNMLRGRDLNLPELAAQNARLGTNAVPAGVSNSTGFLQDANQLRALSGKGEDILQKTGMLPLAGAGALMGGAAGYGRAQLTPEDDTLEQTLLGTGVGAAGLGTLPALSKSLYQPLAQGTEQVLRSSALVAGRERFLGGKAEDLFNLIDTSVNLPAQERQLLWETIQTRGGQMSTQEIDNILRDAGLPPEARSGIAQQWDNTLREADEAGVGLSNEINFDYKNLNNFEEFARQVFPFSTWGTKAFPFFAARLAEHPGIASTLARYQEESDEQRDTQGLSPRFTGSVEAPAVNDIWSAITGRPGTHAFFNPLKTFLPAADASRSLAFEPPDDATAVEHIAQLLQTIGLSEHPALGLATRLSGLRGESPSQGVPIRQAGPMAAVSGIDIAAPGRHLETAIRQGLGQSEPSDPATQATLRRIDELALSQTGLPITSDDPRVSLYRRAKLDRSGGIWEEARRDTERERGSRSAAGFVSQALTPSALLGPEEARISQARAGLVVPADTSREISANAARYPNSQAPDRTVQQVAEASARLLAQHRPELAGETPPQIQALLDNPTWRNLDRLRDLMYRSQADQDPALSAYAGSGSPEKQRIQHALQVYQDATATALARPEFQRMPQDERAMLLYSLENLPRMSRHIQIQLERQNPRIGQLRKLIQTEREQILSQNPALAAYFEYRDDTGDTASLEDFLDRVWPTLRNRPD